MAKVYMTCKSYCYECFHDPLPAPLSLFVILLMCATHELESTKLIYVCGNNAKNILHALMSSLILDNISYLQVLIDGYPLKELDIVWWRERIGYVGQVR